MEKDFIILKPSRNELVKISIRDIIFISCDSYVSTVNTLNNNISVCKILKDFDTDLSDEGFVRINRNVIINIDKLICFQNNNKPQVIMQNEKKFFVSRRRISILLNTLKLKREITI